MSIRQRDVTDEEVDAARAALQAAKESGDHEAIGHAMEVLAIVRAAHREQLIDVGLRSNDMGFRIVQDGTIVISGDGGTVTVPEEG